MTLAQIKKNIKHGDYSILQKLLRLSTESAARQKFLRGDKDAVEGMIKIQENRSIFCDLHADEDYSCHDDLKEAINQKADINHTHDWNEITGKPTEFPPTHHSHDVRDIEGLDDLLHTIDDIRNLSNQKLDKDGSNATGSLASTITNNHSHVNKAILDTITVSKVNDWDNAASKTYNAVTLGSNATGLTITNQVLQFSNGYQLPTTIKLGEYDEAYLMRHSHTNKVILDNLTQAVIDYSHTHGNKALLDSYNQTNANITDAVSLRHSHINKAILDAITAAYTTADKNTLDALAGIQLEADQANALIHIKDGNSVILSTLNVAFLNNEGTQFVYNPTTNTLDLINDYGQILSSIPVSSFVTNLVSNANWNGTTTSRLDFKDNAGTILFSINYTIANIQGLQDALNLKANVSGNNIPFDTHWPSLLAGGFYNHRFVDTNVGSAFESILVTDNGGIFKTSPGGLRDALQLYNYYAQVDGGNLTNIVNWQSVLQIDLKANTSGYYSGLSVGLADNSTKWNNQTYFEVGSNGNVSHFMTFDPDNNLWRKADTSYIQSILGITSALNLNLQQVTNNGNSTTNFTSLRGGSDITDLFFKDNSQPLGIYFGSETNGNIFIGKHSNYSYTGSLGQIRYITNEFHWYGTISTDSHYTSSHWKYSYDNSLMSKGEAFVSNVDANNISNGTEIIAIETSNGTGNTNFPETESYGTFVRQQSRTFTTDFYNSYSGNIYYKTWYNPSGAGSVVWQKIWSEGNLPTSAVNTIINFNPNNYVNRTQNINEEVNGVKQFSGSYLGVVLNGDGNANAWGYLESTPQAFNIGVQVANKPISFYVYGTHVAKMSTIGLEVYNNIYTTSHGSADQWHDAYSRGFKHEYTGGINNGSASRTNQSFFDYNFMGTGRPGVVASFDGLNNTYRLEIAGQYNGGGNDFYIRSMNGDIAQWNPVRLLWHDGNLVNPATETWVTNNFASNTALGNYVSFSGGNMVGDLGLTNNAKFKLGLIADTTHYIWKNPTTDFDEVNFSTGFNLKHYLNGDIATFTDGGISFNRYLSIPNATASNHAVAFGQLGNYAQLSQVYTQSQALALFVGKNGVETIADTKTFTSSPIVPNATLNEHAVNLGQLNASLPTVNNATITYQGTGAITGGGSHTINQSGNSTYSFDLTNQTKTEISLGVNAYNSLSSKQDVLVAGSGISIVGNTISAITSGGGSGIGRIFTDNSSQSGPADEQSGVIFTSHEAYGLPQAEYKHEGNATIAIEDPKTLHLFSSYDSVHTIQTSGNNVHIDIDSIRAHIYNVVKFQAGSNHISVSFPNGIYAGDQINISAQRGTMIYINTPNLISSVGAEIPSHANLVWDPSLQSWVVKSFGY